jgi:dynein intermediate chain
VYDKEGIYEAVQAHGAPITNVHFHPSHKNNDLSDLYLTSSYDWTVKLWSNKVQKPLYTFESARDYVFDVQWSPIHPSLFCMGDGTGRLDLWNINVDTDVPLYTAHVDAPSPTGEKAAISRVQWSDDGSNIAVGTSTGSVHVFNVQNSVARPTDDDTTNFYEKIQKRMTSTSVSA